MARASPRAATRTWFSFGASRTEAAALWILVTFTVLAVAGFATFGRNPELLGRFPWATGIYSVSFTLFSVGQILLAGSALLLLLTIRAGLRWLPAFAALYLLSLASELAGTNVGLPFGHYEYTAALGARWLGDVPAVIPLSWFMMAVPSFYIALRLLPGHGALPRVALGALILTSWDLALDPAMSYVTVYWLWEATGPYYGMPWINLAGWLFTSLLLMAALALLRAGEWIRHLPGPWMVGFYAANVLMPLGMLAAAGALAGVLVTVAAYLALYLLARGLQARPVPEPATS